MYHDSLMARRRALNCALAGDAPLLLYCGEALLARGHVVRAIITDDAGIRRWAADQGLILLTADDDVAGFLSGGIDLLLTHLVLQTDESSAPHSGQVGERRFCRRDTHRASMHHF